MCDTLKLSNFVSEDILEGDLQTLCRICLKNDGTVSIFSEKESENGYTLQDRITSFAYVEIHEGDGLPSQICKDCLIQINSAFHLKAQCEYADLFLRQHCSISENHQAEEARETSSDVGDVCQTECIEDVRAEEIADNLADEYAVEELEDFPGSPGQNTDPTIILVTNLEHVTNKTSEITINASSLEKGFEDTSDTDIFCTNSADRCINLSDEASHVLLKGDIPYIILNTDVSHKGVKKKQENKQIINSKPEQKVKQKGLVSRKNELAHKCTICEKRFALEGSLKYHILKEHEPSGEFACVECGTTFPQEILLDMHLKTHSAERPYCCSSCGKCFMQKSTLLSHERRHIREKRFLCNHCGKFFTSKNQHICPVVNVHREKTHVCNICGKKFMRNSTLATHKKRHRLVEKYRCKVCLKPFYSSQELLRHTRVHTGDRPFACDFHNCEHTFYTKGELNRHLRYHRGEKKFKCDECDLSFFESGHLVNHKRKHTGERPYVCHVCSKSFTDASKLKRHENIHYNASSRRLNATGGSSDADQVSWSILDTETTQLNTSVVVDSGAEM